MEIVYVIISALAPVVVLLWYIFRKDREQPEPAKWLVRAFVYGMISILVSLAITWPLQILTAIRMDGGVLDAFIYAFSMAAIPEETAKLIMLWLLLRKNPYFDEQFDGIVYAVCVGMGFAGVENVMYLVEGLQAGSWIGIGISRAIFAVPGHFLFAVLMGYYYSKIRFGLSEGFWAKMKVWLAPVVAHGVYDGILFTAQINEVVALVMMVVFLVFFIKLAKRGKWKIRKMVGK